MELVLAGGTGLKAETMLVGSGSTVLNLHEQKGFNPPTIGIFDMIDRRQIGSITSCLPN